MTLTPYSAEVGVKMAFSPYRSLHYNFDPSMTTQNMFEYLSIKIQREFGFSRGRFYFSFYDQPQQPRYNENVINNTIREEFRLNPRKTVIAFYIHLIEEITIQEEEEDNTDIDCCPVCLNEETIDNPFLHTYTCTHFICINCFHQCILHNLHHCSLCRQPELVLQRSN